MGMAVSIKDIYAVKGLPTYAGSAQKLPKRWEHSGPVVSALLKQLPSVMGKTHTVEFAFGGLGTNAHWGAPRNPWTRWLTARPAAPVPGRGCRWWEAPPAWHSVRIPQALYVSLLP